MQGAAAHPATVSIDRVIRPAAAPRAPRGPALRRITAALACTALAASVLGVPAAASATRSAGTGGPRLHPVAAASEEASPLAVSIDTMTPSTLPRRGTVTLTGEITNRSDSAWSELYVYLFTSESPMTTPAELAEATATDEAADVGPRITRTGLYVQVPDLEPGESEDYRLTVPVADLPVDAPGVYWIGVHVLGQDETGRADGADGRARTFITSMPPRRSGATMSLVLPLRAPVRRTAQGRLVGVEAWAARLGIDGRLGRLVSIGSSAGDTPLTWLVDPAVVDAARSLSDGDAGFDLEPTDVDPEDPEASPGVGEPSLGPVDPDDSGTTEGDLVELSDEAETAQDWLARFVAASEDQQVLSLPYADVDLATLGRGDFRETLDQAVELGSQTMAELGVSSDPVLAPLDGRMPELGLDGIDPGLPLLLSQSAIDASETTARLRQGSTAVLTSDAARVGGPAPTQRYDPLALRQRILAEAAVQGLSRGADQPFVVTLPELWNPGESWATASFFTGLDVPWLSLIDLDTALVRSETPDYDGTLRYGRSRRRAELPVANVLATQELAASGTILAELLTRNDTIDAQIARAAMLGSSVHARPRPHRAVVRTRRVSEQVHARLEAVRVESSSLVTMSSGSGEFSITVVNGLDEPVTVGIDVRTGTDELTIEPSPEIVSLGAGQRASVRLAVTATGTGVHSVRLVPTTEDGRPLGRSTKVRVRSSQVGFVIWLIMGTGAALFVVAILARIVRRVRDRKRSYGPLLKDPDA